MTTTVAVGANTSERPIAAAALAERGSARDNAVLAFLVRCASAGLLYLSQVVLARWMGATEFGTYITAWTVVLIAGGLSGLGLNLAIIRIAAVYRSGGDDAGVRGLLIGSRVLAAVIGAGAAFVGLGLLGVLPVSDAHRATLFVLLLVVPLIAITEIQDGIGRGHGWMMAGLVPPYLLRPLLLLAGMAIALAAGAPMLATTAAMVMAASVLATAVVQAVWLNRHLTAADAAAGRTPASPRYEPRTWLAASLPVMAIGGAELALQNTDVLVLSLVASPATVAVYFAAAKTMSLVMFVHYAVGSAMASRFAALHARGDRVGLEVAVRDGVRWTFWPSFAGAIAILALGGPLLSLFGPTFADGFPVMAILVLGFLARSATGPAEILLNMIGEQRACAWAMARGAIVGLGLNLVLVPWFGMIGAAIATASALAMVGLLNARAVKAHLGLDAAIWSVPLGR